MQHQRAPVPLQESDWRVVSEGARAGAWKKTIGVPTLKAFAYNMPDYDGLICPVFDARRSQVYAGAYRWNEGKIEEAVKGAPYAIEDFLKEAERAGEKRMFFGDEFGRTKAFLKEKSLLRKRRAFNLPRLSRGLRKICWRRDWKQTMKN